MDTVQITEGPEATHVVLGATMEISMAQALYRQLAPYLAQSTSRSNALVIDASQVQRVDTAALQTLAYFYRCARERGIPFHWQAVSPALRQAAQSLGLTLFLFENA